MVTLLLLRDHNFASVKRSKTLPRTLCSLCIVLATPLMILLVRLEMQGCSECCSQILVSTLLPRSCSPNNQSLHRLARRPSLSALAPLRHKDPHSARLSPNLRLSPLLNRWPSRRPLPPQIGLHIWRGCRPRRTKRMRLRSRILNLPLLRRQLLVKLRKRKRNRHQPPQLCLSRPSQRLRSQRKQKCKLN